MPGMLGITSGWGIGWRWPDGDCCCCCWRSSKTRSRSCDSSSRRGLMHTRPASERKWRPRASARANRRPQPHCPLRESSPRQTNFFSPEWRPSWRLRSCCRANALPHTVHTNGRSSVWVRRWDRRLYARVKRFGHRVHWKVAGCFWIRFGSPGAAPGLCGSARSKM